MKRKNKKNNLFKLKKNIFIFNKAWEREKLEKERKI
jgi:hypothetical protein